MNSVTLGFETILYFKLEILEANFNLVPNDLSRIFGSGHLVQCREMFCGCALKASAAEGVAEEGGEESARCLARPPENAGFLTPSQRSKKARTRRAFAGADWGTMYELRGKEEADREQSSTCFSISSAYDLESRSAENRS